MSRKVVCGNPIDRIEQGSTAGQGVYRGVGFLA